MTLVLSDERSENRSQSHCFEMSRIGDKLAETTNYGEPITHSATMYLQAFFNRQPIEGGVAYHDALANSRLDFTTRPRTRDATGLPPERR